MFRKAVSPQRIQSSRQFNNSLQFDTVYNTGIYTTRNTCKIQATYRYGTNVWETSTSYVKMVVHAV